MTCDIFIKYLPLSTSSLLVVRFLDRGLIQPYPLLIEFRMSELPAD